MEDIIFKGPRVGTPARTLQQSSHPGFVSVLLVRDSRQTSKSRPLSSVPGGISCRLVLSSFSAFPVLFLLTVPTTTPNDSGRVVMGPNEIPLVLKQKLPLTRPHSSRELYGDDSPYRRTSDSTQTGKPGGVLLRSVGKIRRRKRYQRNSY